MIPLEEQIRKQYENLTSSQKLAAKFILDDPQSVALHTAKDIGGLSGTSETTVIRLCYALGYSGYSQLQEEIRKSFFLDRKKDVLETFHEEMKEDVNDANALLSNTILQEVEYIKRNFEELSLEILTQAIQSIIQAEQIIVLGLRVSHSPAYWLSYTLNIIKGNTILYRGEIDDPNYLLSRLNEESLVIAISFPRYTQETVSFVKAAKRKGAKILGITDEYLTPISQETDILLKVAAPQPTTLKGMSVVFSLLNILTTGVMAVDRKNVEKRVGMYEETSQGFYPFTKDG